MIRVFTLEVLIFFVVLAFVIGSLITFAIIYWWITNKMKPPKSDRKWEFD